MAHNVPFDFGTWLVIYLYYRGYLKYDVRTHNSSSMIKFKFSIDMGRIIDLFRCQAESRQQQIRRTIVSFQAEVIAD